MGEFTRHDYLNNECTHRQYYAQFVTDEMKKHISEDIKKAMDSEFFNYETGLGYSLSFWDAWSQFLILSNPYKRKEFDKKLRDRGDYISLAGCVSTLKEAARQIVDAERGNRVEK